MKELQPQQISDFLKKADIKVRGPKFYVENSIELLSELLKEFDPKSLVKVQQLYFVLENTLGISNKIDLDKVLKFTVGKYSKELIALPVENYLENMKMIEESTRDIETEESLEEILLEMSQEEEIPEEEIPEEEIPEEEIPEEEIPEEEIPEEEIPEEEIPEEEIPEEEIPEEEIPEEEIPEEEIPEEEIPEEEIPEEEIPEEEILEEQPDQNDSGIEFDDIPYTPDSTSRELQVVNSKDEKKFKFMEFAIANYSRTIDRIERKNMDDYIKLKGGIGKEILRGTIGLGLTTLKVGTVGTAYLALKLCKTAGKIFKAAKGTLEVAMHNKAMRDLRVSNEVLEKNNRILRDSSRENLSQLDEAAKKYGFAKEGETARAYEIISSSKDGKKDVSLEAEEAIYNGYVEASFKRDEAMSELINYNVLDFLKNKFGFESTAEALEYVRNIEFDENGEMWCPEFKLATSEDMHADLALYGIDENAIYNFKKRDAMIDSISESDKVSILNYINVERFPNEFTGENNCIVRIKSDVDREALPEHLRMTLESIEKYGSIVENDVLRRFVGYNMEIDFLAKCESELITRSCIKANEALEEKLAQIVQKRNEKGFFRQAKNMTSSMNLKYEAQQVVEKRIGKSISDSLTRQESRMEGLLEMAQDKLLGKDESIIDAAVKNVEQRKEGEEVGEEK